MNHTVNVFWGKKPASFFPGYRAATKKSIVKPQILLSTKLKYCPFFSGVTPSFQCPSGSWGSQQRGWGVSAATSVLSSSPG